MESKIKRRSKGNKIVIEGEVLKVYLNGKDNKQPFLFDRDDLEIVERYTIAGDLNRYAVAYDRVRKRNIYLHRAIMGVLDNRKEEYIDHLNGNEQDNRKSNLRICHKGDASNPANITYQFVGHERVEKIRLQDDRFALKISNGIINNLQVIYSSYKELLEDYHLLYEMGVDKGLQIIFNRLEYNSKLGMEQYEKGKDAYLSFRTNYEVIQKSKVIFQENISRNELLRNKLLAEYGELKAGIYIVDGCILTIVDELQTSKDMNDNNQYPSIIHMENIHETEQAGLHEYKPNGEMIHK